ncbi:type II toxin-antitoxin system death-on-curing family toxin [Enterococcus sp. PF-2]|uniref:type II toxin-antitoxin system death-on-curing family toxin n=1 Tax=unclassified Enterococcus TaxID=2608891 RepID=UPI00111F6BCD|nr:MULTISPECIES: type II toxin-antitoxin system death-on-curing family toxin [unclassified Enterococcus]TPE00630.1 type II toxin-antitoxin system death-on-curing family toxin [Enterococcus sp. PF-3]TPE24185.1 type II toxin-antitoxin system death-on-curing family toxin [Enterococcus sp. PF-2]
MIFLTAADVIRINAKVIVQYSKGEMIGVKDASALDMAINQPSQAVLGKELYPTIFDKASILAINLVKRHPFHNGNKRTALVSMITFLQLNGYVTNFSQDEAVHFILTITTSKKEFNDLKEEVASYLQDSNRVRPNF